MQKIFFILPVILFLGPINARENLNQILIDEVKVDSKSTKIDYENCFNNNDISNIVEIIKSGDAYALEYAFESSEKKLLDFQVKYLLNIIDSSIDKLSQKTITNKNLGQIGAVALGISGLIYLEKNNYFEQAELGGGYKLSTGDKVSAGKTKVAVSKLLTPLRIISKYKTGLIKDIKEKFNNPKKTGQVSGYKKSYLENLFGDNAMIKGIAAAVIVTVLGKLIIDGIYTTSGKISATVSDIFLYRKYINKMNKVREVVLKQRLATIS